MKKLLSVIATAVLSLGTGVALASPATQVGREAFVCEISTCSKTEHHTHNICTVTDCKQTTEHSHTYCQFPDCGNMTNHDHNGTIYYGHNADDGHTYHTHGNKNKGHHSRGNRRHH